jgi:hypothetical protein
MFLAILISSPSIYSSLHTYTEKKGEKKETTFNFSCRFPPSFSSPHDPDLRLASLFHSQIFIPSQAEVLLFEARKAPGELSSFRTTGMAIRATILAPELRIASTGRYATRSRSADIHYKPCTNTRLEFGTYTAQKLRS